MSAFEHPCKHAVDFGGLWSVDDWFQLLLHFGELATTFGGVTQPELANGHLGSHTELQPMRSGVGRLHHPFWYP